MSNHKNTELYFTNKINSMLKDEPEYVKSYIRSIHNRTSPRTQYSYLCDINSFLNYEKEKSSKEKLTLNDLSKLKKEDFEDYFSYMESYEKDGKSFSNGRISIKRKISALRHFFNYLFQNEMIKSDEIRKVELPKLHKKDIIYLDDDESINLLETVDTGGTISKKQKDYHKLQRVRDKAIVYLLLTSGIRVSECAELDIDDLDMKKCKMRIIRKGGNETSVYFSDEAVEPLNEWLAQRENIKCVNENEKALFLSSRRQRMSVRSIEIMIKKYAQLSVPAKKITPHKLRSTFATNLYEETNDIYLVAEALGHNDVSTTKEHYAHMSEKHKEQNRNKVKFKKREKDKD